MYAVGHGIKPWRAPRAGGRGAVRRAIVVGGAVIGISLGLAVAAHGGSAPAYTAVVVQPGDTLWGIAAEHYPADDVRIRVQGIEHANGLPGPSIAVGQTLRLPG